MSAPMDSDEEESFVTLGTPLEIYDDGISQALYRKYMKREGYVPNWKCYHCVAASSNTASAIFNDEQMNDGEQEMPRTHIIPKIPDRPLSLLTLSPPSSLQEISSPLPSSPLPPPPEFSSMSPSSEFSSESPSPRMVLTPESSVSVTRSSPGFAVISPGFPYPGLSKGSHLSIVSQPESTNFLNSLSSPGFRSPPSPLGFLTCSTLLGYSPQLSTPKSQQSTEISTLPGSPDFSWPTPPSPLSPMSPPLSPMLPYQTADDACLPPPPPLLVLESFTSNKPDERITDEAVGKQDEPSLVYTVLEKGTLQGKPRLVDNRGFSYCINTRRDSKTYWRCSVRSRACVCPAVVIQDKARFCAGKKKHIHPGKPGADVCSTVIVKLKQRAQEDKSTSASRLVKDVLRDVGDHGKVYLPPLRNMAKIVNYHRQTLRHDKPNDRAVKKNLLSSF